jgi:hypothetical protein
MVAVRAQHDLGLDGEIDTKEKKPMKQLIQLSTAALVAFMMAAPALAEDKGAAPTPQPAAQNAKPLWWAADKFKEKFSEWAAKFAASHAATMGAREANKAIAAAHKAEKDKAARAKMLPDLINKRIAVWEGDIAYLELHKQWKQAELERAIKQWDEKIAKDKERIAKAKEQLAKISEPPTK